jgi:hypothetical protein
MWARFLNSIKNHHHLTSKGLHGRKQIAFDEEFAHGQFSFYGQWHKFRDGFF